MLRCPVRLFREQNRSPVHAVVSCQHVCSHSVQCLQRLYIYFGRVLSPQCPAQRQKWCTALFFQILVGFIDIISGLKVLFPAMLFEGFCPMIHLILLYFCMRLSFSLFCDTVFLLPTFHSAMESNGTTLLCDLSAQWRKYPVSRWQLLFWLKHELTELYTVNEENNSCVIYIWCLQKIYCSLKGNISSLNSLLIWLNKGLCWLLCIMHATISGCIICWALTCLHCIFLQGKVFYVC